MARLLAPPGKEKTPAQCRARARWEREQARKLRGKKYGYILAPGHIAAAEAYEQLAQTRESRGVRRLSDRRRPKRNRRTGRFTRAR
jgi:hypothetical protein